jgi:hypothetical protein
LQISAVRFIVIPSASKMSETRFSAGWVGGIEKIFQRSSYSRATGPRLALALSCMMLSAKQKDFAYVFSLSLALLKSSYFSHESLLLGNPNAQIMSHVSNSISTL